MASANHGVLAPPRVGLARRILSLVLPLTFVAVAIAACGRSTVTEDFSLVGVDGGGDAEREGGPSTECNANTCPGGCCADGVCQEGTDLNACGGFGAACTDCASAGFETCDADLHACVSKTPRCDVTTCAGCCEGDTCVNGVDANECGASGEACAHCAAEGKTCVDRKCAEPKCGPGSCKGCCFGDVCLNGVDAFACGEGGQLCQNCASAGGTCAPSGGGGACKGATTCGPKSCTGCCSGSTCVTGSADTSCGHGGTACTDCSASKKVCSGSSCVAPPKCSPSTCLGCCDATSVCQPGFLDGQCGQGGSVCLDCSGLGSTCDVGGSPRTCSNMTSCPVAYGTCGSGVSTSVPALQKVCSSSDLANGKSACAGGAHTAGCEAFVSFEASSNPACAKCLAPFMFDFVELRGLFSCVAPFVTTACNHSTGCESDCEDQSCTKCPAGNVGQCHADVRSGQCSSFVTGSACVFTPLLGSAAFCNPTNYANNFGGWLQGVGGHFCGI